MNAPTASLVERSTVGRQAVVPVAAYGAVALWGATPLATKVAVADVDPLAVGLLRTLLAGVVALPLILFGRVALPRSGRGRADLAVSALGGFAVFPLLFSYGIQLTTAGHGALLLGILPVSTGLIAALLERRRPGGRWWLGCTIAIAGTALLVGARFELSLEAGSLRGDLLVLYQVSLIMTHRDGFPMFSARSAWRGDAPASPRRGRRRPKALGSRHPGRGGEPPEGGGKP